jgi:hypothetical protein
MKFYFNGKRHYSPLEFIWDKSVAPNALSFLDFYEFGSDTFICDQFDKLIDFDLYERDEIIGPCSVEYPVEEEEEIEEIPDYDSNIFPL